MQHLDDAGVYYMATAGRVVWQSPQNPNNWNMENNFMARSKELNFRVEDVENGFILSLGSDYTGGRSERYVFSTVKELNDFIAKRNTEELS